MLSAASRAAAAGGHPYPLRQYTPLPPPGSTQQQAGDAAVANTERTLRLAVAMTGCEYSRQTAGKALKALLFEAPTTASRCSSRQQQCYHLARRCMIC
jgi:hypothetical protein